MNTTVVDAAATPALSTSLCTTYGWCTHTGDHDRHMGIVAEVPALKQGEIPYLRTWLHDLEDNGELTASVTHYGDSGDFDVAGLRAYAMQIGAFANQVIALTDNLDAGACVPESSISPLEKPSTWTIAIEGGGQISGYLPAWAERSSVDDYAAKPLKPNRFGMLVDVDHWTDIEGIEMNVGGPGFDDPAELESIFYGHLQVRPFDRDEASRVPHVDLHVLDDRWMENLGPDDLADIAGALRTQADRLDGMRITLVQARADWEDRLTSGPEQR